MGRASREGSHSTSRHRGLLSCWRRSVSQMDLTVKITHIFARMQEFESPCDRAGGLVDDDHAAELVAFSKSGACRRREIPRDARSPDFAKQRAKPGKVVTTSRCSQF